MHARSHCFGLPLATRIRIDQIFSSSRRARLRRWDTVRQRPMCHSTAPVRIVFQIFRRGPSYRSLQGNIPSLSWAISHRDAMQVMRYQYSVGQ
jgi:hypothetical protein